MQVRQYRKMRRLAEIEVRKAISMRKENQKGFSLIETCIALVILTVGILTVLGAISFSWRMIQESEKSTFSKEQARSTMETIFSVRDLRLYDTAGPVDEEALWKMIQVKRGNNGGVFLDEWNPIREDPGIDGIYGTADDACAAPNPCTVGAYVNNSKIVQGYEQKVEISDINENGVVRKRLITVRIRYMVGSQMREVAESTILATFEVYNDE